MGRGMTGQGRSWMPVRTRIALAAALSAFNDAGVSGAPPCS